MTSKKDLSKRDISTKFILPDIQKASWDIQIKEELYSTNGRISLQSNKETHSDRKRADFILYKKVNIPTVIIVTNNDIGSPMEIVKFFDERDEYLNAVLDLERGLYEVA